MKVLMLGWEFSARLSGGLGTACRGMVRALCAGGTEVLYVRSCARGAADPEGATVFETDRVPVLTNRAWQGSDARQMLDVRVDLDPYGGRSFRAYPREKNILAEIERYTRAVGEIARIQEFDVVHAHDWMSFAAGLYARDVSGKPLVAHVHSTEFDRAPEEPDPSIIALERAGLLGSDQVICVSKVTRNEVALRYSVPLDRIRVVHNGIEASLKQAEGVLPCEGMRVLFLGRITAQKDPGTFLRAAELVHERLPEVRFVIAGDGDLLPQMVGLARDLGLSNVVRFAGSLDEAEVQRMYAEATVFVMPSRTEPFGLVSLEAMAHGVPVVVTRGAGVLETLPSALVVEPGDYRGLADSVFALLTRPALRDEVVRTGQHEVARASWSARTREIESLYEELVY